MSSFWNFVFGIILVLIWIVAGGFVTQANVYLTSYRNKDDDLHRAYWFSFWAAFITWFLIALFILLVILSVIGIVALFGSGVGEAGVAEGAAAEGGVAAEGAESESALTKYRNSAQGGNNETGISWLTIGFLIFSLILVGITGILSAIAASSMVKSKHFDPTITKLKTAYTDCIIASSLCLGAGGILIIGIIVYFIVGEQREKKIEAEQKLVQKERAIQLQEIKQRKSQILEQKIEQRDAFKQELLQAQENVAIQKIYQQAGVTSPT